MPAGQQDAGRDDRNRPNEDCGPAPAAPGAAPGFVEQRQQPLGNERGFRRRDPRPAHEASITSIIHPVNRSRTAPLSLRDQVAAQIRRAIADGEAGPGERLPPAADLAGVLGVNRNTVLSALRALRDEGLVDFRRGRGVTVAGSPERSEVHARARELVHYARRRGYLTEDLIELIRGVS